MVTFRPYDATRDRDFVLAVHVQAMFEADSASERPRTYPQYRDAWLASSWPAAYLGAIRDALSDPQAIAEIIELDGTPAGFVWASPGEAVEGGQPVYFRIREIGLKTEFQRQGLGRLSMQHLESVARERGASTLRSVGSVRTEGATNFHRSLGFEPYQTIWEKRL